MTNWRNVSPWSVRRKPGTKREYQVVSYGRDGVVVAKDFKNLESAQAFAIEANLMIGRSTDTLKRF